MEEIVDPVVGRDPAEVDLEVNVELDVSGLPFWPLTGFVGLGLTPKLANASLKACSSLVRGEALVVGFDR